MCGIVGYIGKEKAVPMLMAGLKKLEYRGYDSAGIAVLDARNAVKIQRSIGKLAALRELTEKDVAQGTLGIGHTRWATHGKPSVENAHPHTDCTGKIIVIHNGIVENHMELKAHLSEGEHKFFSQTDTEVIPHLIEEHYSKTHNFAEACRLAALELKGAQAMLVISEHEPDKIIAIRIGNAGGLIVGSDGAESYIASDLSAVADHSKHVAYLESREMAVVGRDKVHYVTLEGKPITKKLAAVTEQMVATGKGLFEHYMLKEINEQPECVLNDLRGRLGFEPSDVLLEGMPLTKRDASEVRRIVFLGMGTSMHSAMVGMRYMERLAGVPTEVENASEFRYRDFIADPPPLVISISQSGETVDTLAGMEEAKRRGLKQITLCNAPGAQSTRMADYTLALRCGPEIGVASTKTLASSIACLYLLSLWLGKNNGHLDKKTLDHQIDILAKAPDLMGRALTMAASTKNIAEKYHKANHFLYLGRGMDYPMAMEGALKLKEIAYIHAEGYAAGEMKHGPIALIDERMPVLAIAPKNSVYQKMVSNIQEVKARDGKVIAIATEGDTTLPAIADDVIFIPSCDPLLEPLALLPALQLLAYHMAVHLKRDVDQPRNLAKSVTVE